jgi:hypothetical protein
MSTRTLRRRSSSSPAAEHAEWLGLIDVSGPFLSLKVLLEAFPQGLDADDPALASELRRRLGEWQDNNESRRPDPGIHDGFIRFVLGEILELDASLLQEGPAIPPTAKATLAEYRVNLSPKFSVGSSGADPRLLVDVHTPQTRLDRPMPERGFHASPSERMRLLLRHTGIRNGLVTNGEKWTLVHAPADRTSTFATWDANDLLDERLTFRAFRTLLGRRRLLDQPPTDTLDGLLERSHDDEREVTDQLGLQVRRAVELLVAALDRADREQGSAVLEAVRLLERNEPAERTIYEAAVTVCVRLIFLLAAEARGLLPDDEPWLESYAVGSLRADLQAIADRSGEELLDRRFDAWPRLLATFRAVHSGVEHDRVRLPGYGGGLFDPDRYSFLEQARDAVPRVANRVILRILDALQMLEVPVPGAGRERRPLSYRALGVEQIGHVYERLLDHTAIRADAPALGLIGTARKEPEIGIELLDRERAKGDGALVDLLVKQTGRSRSALKKALEKPPPVERTAPLAQACEHDAALIEATMPYLGLIRDDAYGLPTVFLPGSLYVTESEERGTTGTYYTPPSLSEPIVQYALEPVVYRGPREGAPREQWELKRPSELLQLKVCDIAMGSAAFLVAACRYLAARLVEAWELHPEEAPSDTGADLEERDLSARRMVAERCLYGVDVNRLAVDIAKVSLWLTTLRRDRPFTFVDHALRCGDSLLGLTSIEQLESLTLRPDGARGVLLEPVRDSIRATLAEIRKTREEIEATDAVDLREVEQKTVELAHAENKLRGLRSVGDLVVGAAFADAGEAAAPETIVEAAADEIRNAFAADDSKERNDLFDDLEIVADEALLRGRAPGAPGLPNPFHWALEFPEVFDRSIGGFDAIVGNPPFLGGKKIAIALGTPYREFLVANVADTRRGNSDLVAFFFLRAASLVSIKGCLGLIATSTVAEGDTREVGLDALVSSGWCIYRAVKSAPWPGEAALHVAHVWLARDDATEGLTSSLTSRSRVEGTPRTLVANAKLAFQGVIVLGEGFVLTQAEADVLLRSNSALSEVVRPYLSGEDLVSQPNHAPTRWVIDMGERTEAEARVFTEAFAVIEREVRPERLKKNATAYPRMVHEWWKFWNARPALGAAIEGKTTALVAPRVAKYWAVFRVPSTWVFMDKVVVFVRSESFLAALLTSTIHESWARRWSSTLETRLNYAPTDCFQTFPFPTDPSVLEVIGDRYLDARDRTLLSERQGLTKLYNRVHENPNDASEPIQEIRRLRRELDQAVVDAYGWTDLELDHDFRETPVGLRYTLSEPVKIEALDRLLELNHSRYDEEVALGLHAKKPTKSRPNMAAPARQSNERLFD